MSKKTVWSVYFSATGVTEKIVKRTADAAAEKLGLPQRMFCFNSPASRREELSFGAEDLVVLGVPVYAGRVPNLLLPYVRDFIKGNGAAAVPVVTYGNRDFDDALAELCGVLEKNGFQTAAAGAFVGEHAFSRVLGAGRPDEKDLCLASDLGRRAAEKISAHDAEKMSGGSVPADDSGSSGSVRVPGRFPPGPYYTPRDRRGNPINILKARPKTDAAGCIRCGLCAVLCPLGSVDIDRVSEVTGICMKCNACVKHCPAAAKYFDDPGYLYHKKELEEIYTRRAESRIFL